MNTVSKLLENRIDYLLAICGIVISIILFWISNIKDISYDWSLLLFFPCLIYLILRKYGRTGELSIKELDYRTLLLLNSAFILVFTASIFVLYYSLPHKPVSYFVLTIISVLLVSAEIFMLRSGTKNIILALSKILLISISLRWSVLYQFPSIIGNDVWYHALLIKIISQEGYIPPIERAFNYSHYPIAHLIASITHILTALDLKNSIVLSIGLITIFGIVFIFLIGKKLGGPKVGLIAALLMCICSQHIMWSAGNIIAMSLGLTILPLIIFLLFKMDDRLNSIKVIGMVLILSALTILTHIIVTVILFTTFFLFYIATILYHSLYTTNKQIQTLKPVEITLVTVFFVMWMGYWMYVSGSMVDIGNAFDVVFKRELMTVSSGLILGPGQPGWVLQLEKTEKYLYPFFFIIGALYWCNPKKANLYRLLLSLCGAILLIIISTFTIGGISETVIVRRWIVFMYILISTLSAMGIILISNYPKRKTNKIFVYLCIILLFTTFGIMSHYAIGGNEPAYYHKENPSRFAFMQSELNAANRLTGIYAGPLVSDGIYNIYLRRYLERDSEDLICFAESKHYVNLREQIGSTYQFRPRKPQIKGPNEMILIREYIMRDYDKQNPANELETLPYNRIYDSKTVIAYL